jgi:hypothetical protein
LVEVEEELKKSSHGTERYSIIIATDGVQWFARKGLLSGICPFEESGWTEAALKSARR